MDELIRRWRREGVGLLPPRGEREVVAALRRAGRPFARDVVGLYCATGGMADGEMDGECLTLWALGRVARENSRHARPHLLFMDFLINSHAYALRYEDEETSSVFADYYGAAPGRRVAGSLGEFFRLRLNDPSRLFL